MMDTFHDTSQFDNEYFQPVDIFSNEQLLGLTTVPQNGSNEKTYAHQLCALERLLEQLAFCDDVPVQFPLGMSFDIRGGRVAWYERYFEMVPDFIDVVNVLPKEYDYHEYINVFIACCQSLNLLGAAQEWRTMVNAPYQCHTDLDRCHAVELFITLLNRVWVQSKSDEVRAKFYTQKYEAQERLKEYCEYVNALFDASDRLIVLRLDLYYKKGFSNRIGLQEVGEDLSHLIQNMRTNSLFDAREGYIFKIEFGIDKGIHVHAVFFFNGSQRNPSSHIHHAEQIGEYWIKTITRGRGDYWNCNAQIKEFDRNQTCGIGLIHWSDNPLRHNLLTHVVGYVCKTDQLIKPKSGMRVRLLRRGNFPEVPKNKLGRRRQLI